MIHGMNMNEWFIEWTGMDDSLHELEWIIRWMNGNEWFIEWTGMKDSLNEE